MPTTTNRAYRYPGQGVEPDVAGDVQKFAEDVDADVEALENELRAVPPFGHMGRTSGFQAMAGTGNIVAMAAAQDLAGGMTFEDATDSLVVPKTGRYRITVKGMATGGGGTIAWAKCQKNLLDLAGTYTTTWKADNGDVHWSHTVTRPLTAGDKVNLINGNGSGTLSTWGTNGYDGTYLELAWAGPL